MTHDKPVRSMVDSFPLRVTGVNAGLRLYVHEKTDIHVSRQIREHGIWEAFETELVVRLLGPGQCFLDVGANIGYYSVLAAHLVGPQGRVVAFEPEPANFALLQDNIQLNQLTQATAVAAALAATSGTARLHLNLENRGDHQLFPQDETRESLQVQLLNGAEYLSTHGLLPDLVKIDTQGAESAVVAGLMPVLKTVGAGLRLIVELTPAALRAADSSGRELVELLAQLGLPFHIIDHIEHRLVATPEADLALWCDNVDSVPEDQGFMNILVGEV
ncbi:FkbM family methyltransferase [Halieaceae bacterium IMCC14734]|uniref:FkbM family methyltransferase n=1 Tax=Candidatus Litorirhabdus singularis TaxID=2518993 RepID=A0ABT3THB8_9GAMM|nr:FkbM family methyltransferase [Candidatus Litorirhabdus singularis]MCX2981718.1 FkbM family methyltransferase [Candidatus Litorirhabdus singularis]